MLNLLDGYKYKICKLSFCKYIYIYIYQSSKYKMTNDIPSFMSTIIYRCRYISKRLYKTKINNKLAHQNSNLFKPSIHIYYHIIICKIIVRQIFNLQNIYLFYNPWFEGWKQTNSFIIFFFNLRTILVIHATHTRIKTVFCWNVARVKTFVERRWYECALLTTESEIFEALSDDALATFAFQT